MKKLFELFCSFCYHNAFWKTFVTFKLSEHTRNELATFNSDDVWTRTERLCLNHLNSRFRFYLYAASVKALRLCR